MGGSGVTIKSVVGLITFAEVYAVELNHACPLISSLRSYYRVRPA